MRSHLKTRFFIFKSADPQQSVGQRKAKSNGANFALRARKGESPECKLCATHNRRSN